MTNDPRNSNKENESTPLELRLKQLEKMHQESHDIFRHILTAITIVFVFVGIIITALSISSKRDVDSAIREMERKFEVLSNRALEEPELSAFYDGRQVSGGIINIAEYDVFTIPMTRLRIVNIGTKPTDELTIKLFTNKKLEEITEAQENVGYGGLWEIEGSTLETFQSSAVYTEHFRLNPTEPWGKTRFLRMHFEDKTLREVMTKLIIYYGTKKPLEVDFELTLPVRPSK